MRVSTKTKANATMQFGTMKNEVLTAIKVMRFLVGEKSVKEALRQFTTWGFYRGEPIIMFDEKLAMNVTDQLECYVNSLTKMQINQLKNVYLIVGKYLYMKR